MLFELVFVPSYCTEDVRVCRFVLTLFSFLVSYFCNLLAFSSTFLVATKISVLTSRVSLFYWLNLKSLFHLLCAFERARGERASRRSIRRDFLFLRAKKVLRREFSGLREVLFISAGLAFSIYRVACRYYFMYDTNCLLDVK